MFAVRGRSAASRARTGTLQLAHGDVATPAFVPLATRGAVKTLAPHELEQLGYEMVLGNTFHLFLAPGPELIREFGGLGSFMRWGRPIITDSGGFQVFSMGHGGVADEIKGRGRGRAGSQSAGAILAIEEEGVRFRSYVDGSDRFLGPGDLDGGAGGARVGHRAGARRVHPVPRLTRVHRPVDGTHPAMARALPALARAARTRGAGGVRDRAGRGGPRDSGSSRAQRSRRAGATGSRSAARSAARRPRCTRSSAGPRRSSIGWCRSGRGTCSGSATSTTCSTSSRWGSTRSTARCRRGSAATAWRSCRIQPQLAARPRQGPLAQHARADPGGLRVPGLHGRLPRAYLHYLLRAGELTALRLVTLHNLRSSRG